jgi:chromosome partitioning protein
MHTLALVNQKGGCGKTTTAVHLAAALAAKRERVLVVDLDPQAHATLALGCAVEGEPTVADVLRHGVPIRAVTVAAPGGITLLPATLALGEFEEVAARSLGPERVLRQALERVEGDYDHVLVDCPPRVDGVLAANALRAADTVLLVVETGTFALQGALRAILLLEEFASGLETEFSLRVLATLFDRHNRLARELLVAIQARFHERMFDTVIHASDRLREGAALGVPVQVLDAGCAAAAQFEALADEVRTHASHLALDPIPRRPRAAPSPTSPLPSTPRAPTPWTG